MTQSEAFYEGEGDAWLKRNKKRIPIKNDLVLTAFSELVGGISPQSRVLEIGCSNGWRLEALKNQYGCSVTGLEPSEKGVSECLGKGITCQRGYANALPFDTSEFDVVIYGFCLYLCDREDLFAIAKEGDRVLKDTGLMVIYDFNPIQTYKVAYKHKKGVWSYHQPYESMFLWNPAYTRLTTTYHKDGQTKATILRKSMERGWPVFELGS